MRLFGLIGGIKVFEVGGGIGLLYARPQLGSERPASATAPSTNSRRFSNSRTASRAVSTARTATSSSEPVRSLAVAAYKRDCRPFVKKRYNGAHTCLLGSDVRLATAFTIRVILKG